MLELGGTVPGDDYDLVTVNGAATLGGCLRIECLENDPPAMGAIFTPFVATSMTGVFDEVVIDALSSRLLFDLMISDTGVTATANALDVSNFADWRTAVFNAEELADDTVSGSLADPDEDGLVNLMEYALDGNPKRFHQPGLIALNFQRDMEGKVEFVLAEFPWANGTSDIGYELQSSADLENWVRLESEVTGIAEADFTTRLSLRAAFGDPEYSYVRLSVFKRP